MLRRALVTITVLIAGMGAGGAPIASAHPGGVPATIESSRTEVRDAAPAAADLEERFLTTRPTVGPTQIVHVEGESAGRVLTARTLQGLVNRSMARVYVIDGGDPAAQGLLDRYVDRGLVTVTGDGGLDAALDRFASEAAGYVLADPSQPWSVHAATVIAGLAGGVVTTEDQVAALEARGLIELDDTRGRWTDATTAYADLASTYRAQLPSKTMAVVRPSDTLWDFVLQQGLLPVFTRPSDPSWAPVSAMFDAIPDGSPVYGYLSDTGDEEVTALATLASTNLALVPTDTTRNLSFHIAVGADRERVKARQPDLSTVAPCSAETVNIVVGITDGDNMNVPLNRFLRATDWDSPRRGDLPLAWSIGPGLAVLAPAAWDTYALEATEDDELVAMIGWAYSAPALLDAAHAKDFYETSFALMDDIGMRTFWSLGGGLDSPGSAFWDGFDAAAGTGVPDGVLVGYGNATGEAFYSPAGRPAFTSRSVYGEGPAQLAQHITDLQALPAGQRPLVSFLSATNWTNPAGALLDTLAPFRDQGVRFLTPAQATACVPPAPEPLPPTAPEPGTCLPLADTVVRYGLPVISSPIAAEIGREPFPLQPPMTVTATPSVLPGGRIDYTAKMSLDLSALAQQVLDDRVRPIIEAGYGPELAESAWLIFRYHHLTIPFALPASTIVSGTPKVASNAPWVKAAWTAQGVAIDIDANGADTRKPAAPIEVTLQWSVLTTTDAAGPILLRPGPISFGLDLHLGVLFGGTTGVSGGVSASWTCLEAAGQLATTAVVPPPTTTTTTSTTTSTSTTTAADPGANPTAAPVASPARPLAVAPAFAG